MPERVKGIDQMTRTLTNAPMRQWNDKFGSCPDGVDQAVWDEAQVKAERMYVDLVESFDFARILIEAQGRHASVHPGKGVLLAAAEIGDSYADTVCPECIQEVLLALNTRPSRTEQPESPRYVLYSEPGWGEMPVDPDSDLFPA